MTGKKEEKNIGKVIIKNGQEGKTGLELRKSNLYRWP